MITEHTALTALLDREYVAFLTTVNGESQPQTSPIWFMRDGDDLVVYNRPSAPRLISIAANPKVAFNLRGDLRGDAVASLEGEASIGNLPPATEFPGYIDKYGEEIARLGWTNDQFAGLYSAGLRIRVTRVRAHGLDSVDE